MTGFKALDNSVNGLQPTDLCIVAGRPSMGKTAMMNCMASNMCKKGKRVLFFSAETAKGTFTERVICTEATVDSTRLRQGIMNPLEWTMLREAATRSADWEYFLNDTVNIDVGQIFTRAMMMKQQEQFIDAIFVDFLQKLTTTRKFRDPRLEVSHTVAVLKTLSRKLEIPVIAGCQINRGVDNRKDPRPTMADLKETGKIEEEADIIFGMYRPEQYKKGFEKKKCEGLAEVIVMKNRNGRTGIVDLSFRAKFTRFETLAKEGRDYDDEVPF